jgi:hypothetical protein
MIGRKALKVMQVSYQSPVPGEECHFPANGGPVVMLAKNQTDKPRLKHDNGRFDTGEKHPKLAQQATQKSTHG